VVPLAFGDRERYRKILRFYSTVEVLACVRTRALLWVYVFQPLRVVTNSTTLDVTGLVTELLAGTCLPFSDTDLQQTFKDEIEAARGTSDAYKGIGEQTASFLADLLKNMFADALIVLENQAGDQLPARMVWGKDMPAGRFVNPSTKMRKHMKFTKATNRPAESVFAAFDRAAQSTPKALHHTLSGIASARFNNLGEWLRGLTREQQECLVEWAISMGKASQIADKERMAEQQQKKLVKLERAREVAWQK
jgi:hypothetical protein